MLSIGTGVEVRERFCGRWAGGFEIVDAAHDQYVVRRTSDRSVLPASFSTNEIRRAE